MINLIVFIVSWNRVIGELSRMDMNTRSITLILLCLLAPCRFAFAADIALPEIGDSAGALVSPQEEYRIGQAFYWRLQQSVDLVDDPEVTSYLSRLGERLVSHSDAPALSFTFFMVPDPSINAFAAPGGFIGVNSGLLLTSQQEDELASVLAHEIAHVTQRHLLRSFEQNSQMNIPRLAALVGAVLLGAADAQAGVAAMTIVQASGVQAQINHTRAHEAEADNLGMQNLVRSGFDAQAMPTFFERLQQSSRFYNGSAIPEFLRTHPVTTSRIAEARGRAVNYGRAPLKQDDLAFYLIREKLRVNIINNLTELKQFYVTALEAGNARRKEAMEYGYALALLKSGEYSRARTAMTALIEQDPERLAYQLALAEIERSSGRLEQALAIYQRNQRLFPHDYALATAEAKLLLQMKAPEKAEDILLDQVKVGHEEGSLYKLLAQAYGDMNETSEAHRWLAEYYYQSGHLKFALDQFKLSEKAAIGDRYQEAKVKARIEDVKATQALLKEYE